jgi:hypothetical protein
MDLRRHISVVPDASSRGTNCLPMYTYHSKIFILQDLQLSYSRAITANEFCYALLKRRRTTTVTQ